MESIQQDRKRIQQKPVSRAYPVIHTYISAPQGKQESYDGDSDRGEERTQEQEITGARGFQEARHSTIPHERTRITSCTATPCERTTPYYKSAHRDSPYCKVHSGYASTASECERASRTSSSDDPGSSDRSSS